LQYINSRTEFPVEKQLPDSINKVFLHNGHGVLFFFQVLINDVSARTENAREAGIASATPHPFRAVEMAAFPQKENIPGQPVAVCQMMMP